MPGIDLQTTGATALGKGIQPINPLRIGLRLGIGNAREAHQRLVHFIGIGRRWPGLIAHRLNGLGIQRAEVVGGLWVGPAPVEHGLGAALFQRRVVEKGVRPGAENFGGQR
ncbi:hypothetical protein D3C84_811170 [compost metagenome]